MTRLVKLLIILLSILLFGKYVFSLGVLLLLLNYSLKKVFNNLKQFSYNI